MPVQKPPLPLLSPLIDRGRRICDEAIATREKHRRRRRPDRARELVRALERIDSVMPGLRRWMGAFTFREHHRELDARQLSKDLQAERHKLKRLLKKTRS